MSLQERGLISQRISILNRYTLGLFFVRNLLVRSIRCNTHIKVSSLPFTSTDRIGISRAMRPEILKVAQLPSSAARTAFTSVTENELEREITAKRIWRNADAVCFDVDSTICQDEAIDELANFLGVGEEIAKCTERAMNGSMTFRDALTQRLEIMQPSFEQLEAFAMSHPPLLTPGIRELVAKLHRRQIDVYLISGGFRRLILPTARLLNIPKENVFANEILFDNEGNYAGFDESELTSDSGSKMIGKPGVCGLLKRRMGYENLVMVGDGATDMEASPPADVFIGFAGNQCRESVKRGAPWLVYEFDTLRRQLI